NALRIMTGNVGGPGREFKLAIREISAVITDPALASAIWGMRANPSLRGILNIANKAKRGARALASPNPISSKLDGPGFVPPGMREFPRRARDLNACHPGASRGVSRVVAGAPN